MRCKSDGVYPRAGEGEGKEGPLSAHPRPFTFPYLTAQYLWVRPWIPVRLAILIGQREGNVGMAALQINKLLRWAGFTVA